MFRRLARLLPRALAALLALAVVGAAFALVRARTLPDVEVPILRYPRIDTTASADRTASTDDFLRQLADLGSGGFEAVTPARLRQYAVWGRPLPPRPVLLTIDEASAALLPRPATAAPGAAGLGGPVGTWSVEEMLRDLRCTALVDLPEGPAALRGRSGDADPRATAQARGVLRFAPFRPGADGRRPRFGFSDEEGVARIGPRTDFSALPRLTVPGGEHRFAVEVLQDSVDPAFFGTLRVRYDLGEPIRISILAYGKGAQSPTAQFDVPAPLAPGQFASVALPAGIAFPVEVDLYDPTRTILHYVEKIPRRAVVRAPNYRPPLAPPSDAVSFEPL